MRNIFFILLVLYQLIINAPYISAQNEKLPWQLSERIIIDTDREVYVAGEKVHFKLSLFQVGTFKFSSLSKYAYVLLINESDQNLISFPVNLSNGVFYSNFLLPDTISTGVYRLVAYTNLMRNFNQEDYAYRNIIVANRFDNNLVRHSSAKNFDTLLYSAKRTENSPILVSSLQNEYKCGDSIILDIRLSDRTINNAGVSVTVTENAPTGEININGYSGKLKDSAAFCKELRFIPEIYHPVIQGSVLKKNSPEAGVRIMLSSPDSIVNFQYVTTDNNGVFRFQLSNYYDNRKLVLKLVDHADSGLTVKYDNKFNFSNHHSTYPFNYKLPEYLIHSQKIVTVQKSYFNFQQIKNPDYRRVIPPMLYMKPRSIVYPSDFIQLVDMVEISKEILPPVRIYKKDDKFKIEMSNSIEQAFFKKPPLILYNGVPVDRLDQILHLGSADISRIEMIDLPWEYGDLEFQGVLGIFSPYHSIDKIISNSNTIVVDNPGPYPTVSFDDLLPNTEGTPAHFPDFRQLLYWNPDITIFREEPKLIKFKAPQNEGVFKIAINGITNNNQPITYCQTFLIKR